MGDSPLSEESQTEPSPLSEVSQVTHADRDARSPSPRRRDATEIAIEYVMPEEAYMNGFVNGYDARCQFTQGFCDAINADNDKLRHNADVLKQEIVNLQQVVRMQTSDLQGKNDFLNLLLRQFYQYRDRARQDAHTWSNDLCQARLRTLYDAPPLQ